MRQLAPMKVTKLPTEKHLTILDVKKSYKKGLMSAEKLNPLKVQQFFESKGYQVCSVSQHFRNAYGRLRRGRESYFFKLASCSELSLAIQNEIVFAREAKPQFQKTLPWLLLPTVVEKGSWDNRSFYISNFFTGSPLAQPRVGGTRNLRRFLQVMVEVTLSFSDLDVPSLPYDRRWKRLKRPERKFWKEIVAAYRLASVQEVRPVEDLFRISSEVVENFETQPSHGDFVPWHFLRGADDGLVLIDTEFASAYRPKFFDVAYLYHRVYTATGRRDLARAFAAEFRSRLPRSNRKGFDILFRSLVAFRTMACFVEFIVADLPPIQERLYKRLSREILTHDLY